MRAKKKIEIAIISAIGYIPNSTACRSKILSIVLGGFIVKMLNLRSQLRTGIKSRPTYRLFSFSTALALAAFVLETASALSPLDPAADIPWDEDAAQAGTQTTFASVDAIESAFTNARRQEEIQLGFTANSLGNMTLPAQASWNTLSLADKALLIVNSERVARAGVNYGAGTVLGLPLEAAEGNINTLSQAYTDYMIANDFWSHNAPAGGPAPFAGTSPFDRIDNDPAIGNGTGTGGANCHQFLSGAENLGAFASSPGTTIPMPVERAIYGFIYNDAGSAWGHRHLVLLQDQSVSGGGGFTNDRGSAASEGFLGIGNGGVSDGSYSLFNPVTFPVQQIVVFMMFDPTPDAACNYTIPGGGGAPGPTTLISPTGFSATTNPTYTWNAVANSTWYNLWVNDGTGNPIRQWITATDAGCSAGTGTCSTTPTIPVIGLTTWWVRTWNNIGIGPWSSSLGFTVAGNVPPVAATPVSPTGAGSTAAPTYTWNAVPNSTWYYLWINTGAATLHQQWYTAIQAGCGSGTGTCSITPAAPVAGNSRWWVRTWNSSGIGPWSGGLPFSP